MRGILRAHWDEEKGEYTSSLFRGPNTSVSRLRIFPKERIIDIFKADFDAHIDGPVIGTGEIVIADLIKLGKEYKDGKGKPRPQLVTVIPKPTATNDSHAEVVEEFTRGFARKVIVALKKERLDGSPMPSPEEHS